MNYIKCVFVLFELLVVFDRTLVRFAMRFHIYAMIPQKSFIFAQKLCAVAHANGSARRRTTFGSQVARRRFPTKGFAAVCAFGFALMLMRGIF